MPVEITRMTEADVDGAIDCIQVAFAKDPYNNWVFDTSKFSKERNRVSLGIRCRWGIKHALFYVAKDPAASDPSRVLGVAMWLSPSNPFLPQSWSDYIGSWSLWGQQVYMNLVYGRGGLNVKRYWIWKDRQAEAQKSLWTDENGYYFCNIVTVLPETQGMGIGKKLFNVVMRQADEEGRKCYLESSRAEPNMAIYNKMGFELAKEMTCDDDGTAISLYCMMRNPVAK
ncbi:hypothetical protein MBLNU459_g3269t1 [Dothideomycetes sp. NU459]